MRFLHPDSRIEATEAQPEPSRQTIQVDLPAHLTVADVAAALKPLGLTLKLITTPRTEH